MVALSGGNGLGEVLAYQLGGESGECGEESLDDCVCPGAGGGAPCKLVVVLGEVDFGVHGVHVVDLVCWVGGRGFGFRGWFHGR